jgi:type IV secretory pathway VirB4 component
MKKEHQETLLQTIMANLERNEKGNIVAISDPNGEYTICDRTEGKLIKYFTPQWVEGIDPYGNITQPKPQLK